ncbi:MAG: hypothetical protein AB9836_00535 [Aminipila sp.]
MKIRLKYILGIGIPLGIILAIVKNVMDIGEDTFWKYYIILSIIVITVVVSVSSLYQLRFARKLSAINKQVMELGNLDLFFEDVEKMLKITKSRFHRSLLMIDLCYGLGKKKEYAKGLEVLESIDLKSLRGINKIIHYLDKVCFNFYLGNYEEVIHITEENRENFLKFDRNVHIDWNIAANHIYYNIAKGQTKEAENLLQQAKSQWKARDMQEEWERIDEELRLKL